MYLRGELLVGRRAANYTLPQKDRSVGDNLFKRKIMNRHGEAYPRNLGVRPG